MKTKTPAWVMEELQKAQKAKSNGGRRTSTVIPATAKNNTLKRTATSPAHLVTGGSEKKMLSKDMQIKLLRTKVERLNHRIEELMANNRIVKRQKNEIEALRIDLARRSTGSMPHDDLVDEIDRLNQAIAAYKIGEGGSRSHQDSTDQDFFGRSTDMLLLEQVKKTSNRASGVRNSILRVLREATRGYVSSILLNCNRTTHHIRTQV